MLPRTDLAMEAKELFERSAGEQTRLSGVLARETDRRGVRFPVQCMGACSEVLNSVPLELCDRPGEIAWADFGVARLTVEPETQWGEVLRRCFAGEPPAGEWTRGLAYRGIE